ncbi:chalcone isomerase family protein [Ideonella livida]|uniref:Chalcone isomerase domain-containing protein n=1 Tax=Ideonella livida TaxID=2707176 RepID=A0A7C9PFT6_9BURK|nr:chalcone isomerase family protein [Ideonella livida]NDY90833.1 hypothetical protein [Ideonella livida]
MTESARMPPPRHRPAANALPAQQVAMSRRRASLALAGSGLALWVGLPHVAQAADPGPARPIRAEGHVFAAEQQVGNESLQLNGVGLRAVAWVKGYAAALYLTRRSASPSEVIALPGAKRLQLRLLMEAPAEEFVKAFDKGVFRNAPAERHDSLRPRVAAVDAQIRGLGTLRKGDLVDLDFQPTQGLTLRHNGRVLGAPVPGADLYGALLAIFIGPKAIDPEMRTGLLGGPVG